MKKTSNSILFLIIFLLIASFQSCKQNIIVKNTSVDADTIYIPKDLEDCYVQIDKKLADSTKSLILTMTEDDFSARMHFGLGMWMRNNWGFWRGSRLSKYFNEKGIYHPDDMSGIILNSYYRNLMGKEIKLDEQIKYYQNFWKITNPPSKDNFPRGAKKLEFNSGLYYDSKTNGQGYIHVGTMPKSSDIWLYDYYYGWKKVNETDFDLLRENKETREQILIEIYKK
jgi:hypothetical protein